MATKEMITLWFPCLFCIGAILFVSMFALDSFQPGIPFSQQVLNFLVHLIPSLVLLLLIANAWKRQLIGGILFTIAGIGLSPFVYTMNYHTTHSFRMSLTVILIITIPFNIVGIPFIISHFLKKRKKN